MSDLFGLISPPKTTLGRAWLVTVIATLGLAISCGGGGSGADPARGDADSGSGADSAATATCPSGEEGDLLFSFQADGAIHSTPAVSASGDIYFATMNFKVYGLDCRGEQRWVYQYTCEADGLRCPHAFVSSPAISGDGSIIIGDDHIVPNYLFSFTPSGELRWDYESWLGSGQMDASPAIAADGVAFVGTRGDSPDGRQGQLIAMDAEGHFLDGFPIDIGAVDGSPVVIGDTVFVGYSKTAAGELDPQFAHTLAAYHRDGTLMWERALSAADGYPKSYKPLSSLAVDSAGDILVVVHRQPEDGAQFEADLVRVAAADGAVLASTRLGGDGCTGDCAPVIHTGVNGEEVLIAIGGGMIDRVDPSTGQSSVFANLSLPADAGTKRWPSPVVGDDGAVYALGVPSSASGGGSAAAVYRLDASGEILGEYPFGTETEIATTSLQLSASGVLLVGTRDGRVFGIRSAAGGQDPRSPWPSARHDERNTGDSGR